MRNKQILLSAIFIFTILIQTHAQKMVNSPFSRFNLGTIEPTGSFRSQGMGGVSAGMRDNSSIFFTNPASYSSLDTNSFVFDFGLDYSISHISDSASTYKSDDLNFDHLIIGFPLKKGWGVAAGVVPYSNGYFSLIDEVHQEDADYNPLIGEYSSFHYGQGSLTKFFIGTGVKILDDLSAGANMNLIFGDLSRTNKFEFEDVLSVYHNNSSEKLSLSGMSFDLGLQYAKILKGNYFLNAGVSYSFSSNYKVNYEHFVYKYSAFNTLDTISYTNETSGKATIPGTVLAGIAFGKLNKFIAALDFSATSWSKAKIPGLSGYAADSRQVMLGFEYTPEKYSNFSLLRRMDYRLGFHAGNNYLIINGKQIKEVGVTGGIGVPISRRTPSKTNIFADYTRRSGAGSSLESEDFYTVGISLNLYDWWFIKKKYD